MTKPVIDAELVARQLGNDGVDHLVADAARICTCEQENIARTNEAPLNRLQVESSILLSEDRRLSEILEKAPPTGSLRRLRLRAIYCWIVTVILTVTGFFGTMLSFAPFALGWVTWLISAGMAVLTPFLVDHLLEYPGMERALKVLTAAAAAASLASLMTLALIRGDLLGQQMRESQSSAVILDDSSPKADTPNTFYDRTTALLRLALFLMAFAMEAGAGLVLRAAWRSSPDDSQDWTKLRHELIEVRHRLAQIAFEVTMLRNEPAIFAARFRRDFYRALLLKATDSAMKRILAVAFAVLTLTGTHARAEDHLNLVIAIDLTRSVEAPGPDGKSEYQNNVDGVGRLLAQVAGGSRITIIGITDHSFAQPYILLSASVPDDPGYFGERLAAARGQLIRAWKLRSSHLAPHFQQTDILGVFQLANEIFAQHPDVERRTLVIFSDMRQSTPELDLESLAIVPSFSAVTKRCGTLPGFKNVQAVVLGADGAGKSSAYWQSLRGFWKEYFRATGATLLGYSVLRELSQGEFAAHP